MPRKKMQPGGPAASPEVVAEMTIKATFNELERLNVNIPLAVMVQVVTEVTKRIATLYGPKQEVQS